MPLDHTVTITGTDPQNIRTAGHALERLAQLRRDLAVMHEEFRREAVQVDGIISQGLADHGLDYRQAAARADFVSKEFRELADLLERAHDQAATSAEAIRLTGVKPGHRPQWRPVEKWSR